MKDTKIGPLTNQQKIEEASTQNHNSSRQS